MSVAEILLPLFVQVGLTFVLMFWMASLRVGAIRRGDVKMREIALRQPWPERAQQISNAFHNQLELPLLFYAVVAFAMLTKGDDGLMIILAWIYVAFRYLQAFVHATYNKIVHRFGAFVVSVIVLAIMWVHLFLHVASAAI